jgi:hypothetical protein
MKFVRHKLVLLLILVAVAVVPLQVFAGPPGPEISVFVQFVGERPHASAWLIPD